VMDTFAPVIDSLAAYFSANMSMLDTKNRADLLGPRPIYTKVRDDIPALYGAGTRAVNSLISDGTVIEGAVEGSVIFRGVTVEKGAVVKDSILLPGTTVRAGARVNCVIADKEVVINRNRELSGAPTFPLYIGKEIAV
ncbi:MAG: glucose-1-phosphate adenylyltransferase subunit GlgD, partial [Clostridia bacterium]|nr:glucose-1-phosphate adenylyltransferase subunit GlgD [Clostridia bacterium]